MFKILCIFRATVHKHKYFDDADIFVYKLKLIPKVCASLVAKFVCVHSLYVCNISGVLERSIYYVYVCIVTVAIS